MTNLTGSNLGDGSAVGRQTEHQDDVSQSSDLPEGWVKVALSEVVAVNPKHKDLEDQVAGFVPMALAPTDFNGLLNYEERQWDDIKNGYTHFATGDVIFAKVTPCFENGKAAIVKDLPNDIGAGSTEFYVLRPAIKDISVNYIFSVIKSYEFLQTGAENMTGAVGLRRVPKKFVEDFRINLPPLAEQKVIADKLDELLAQVESTKARLDAIPAILKSFRQSVLAAAVSGKLTEEWRDTEIRSWHYHVLKDLCTSISDGDHQAPPKAEKGVPFLVISNVNNGEVNFDKVSRWVPETYYDSLKGIRKPQLNDILYTVTGSLGIPVIVKTNKPFCFQRHIAILKPDHSKVNYQYLELALKAPDTFEHATNVATGTAQKTVSLTSLREFNFYMPPLEEQNEIVRRAEELFAFADKVEAQVNVAQQRVNNLTQSILAKAFRGELTADWRTANPELISGDNSASALLKRIKDEREALDKAIKSAKKKFVKKVSTKKVTTKKAQDTTINKNLSPVESVIADGIANKPQEIFDKLTPSLSMAEVFNEISKLLNDNKIEEKTVDGITGFFIK
ncbi:restriction endonuclease subunit S [Shewanella sp. SP1S2-4]|uniref:restriction endonuclease subunit S n=1 Tax=Shewanella sp. SP1S2-4 TaxID=3063537 RepID=UPI00288DD25A|nr:restriction endonuclease subunit S [Shewanella sp. SP1S2-4]MDT3320244.1 restriction endonuclease subunit S [Shewanella sp. SP1S2-4]